jgi:hypothetical protein
LKEELKEFERAFEGDESYEILNFESKKLL